MATAPQADLYGKLKRYTLATNYEKLWENKYMHKERREIKLQGPDQRPVNFKNALEKMRKGNHVCVHCNEEYVMQTDGYYPGNKMGKIVVKKKLTLKQKYSSVF